MKLKLKPKHLQGVPPRRKPGEKTPAYKGRGCPTDYRPEYCESLVSYFDVDSWYINETEKGAQQVIPKNKLPTLARWARSLGFRTATLYLWAQRHPEFAAAMAEAMELQQAFILEAGGITMNAGFATWLLKCNHGMKDEVPDDETEEEVEMVVEGKGQNE